MQGPYPHGVLLGRQTNKRTKFQIDISVMTVISTIRECTQGWQWPVYLPSWYLGSPLKQANLSCSLTEGRDPITGRAQGVCAKEREKPQVLRRESTEAASVAGLPPTEGPCNR